MRWGYSSEFEECLRQNHESGDATASGLLAGQLLIKAGWHRMRSHEEGARADEVEALALLGRMVEVGLDECLDDFQFLKAALSADVVADAESAALRYWKSCRHSSKPTSDRKSTLLNSKHWPIPDAA